MTHTNNYIISTVRSTQDLEDTIDIFTTYFQEINVAVALEGWERERLAMPGEYGPPFGELVLARHAETHQVLGVIALRPISINGTDTQMICEMKRCYVYPPFRGIGLGKALVKEIINVATRMGYKEMWLATAPWLMPTAEPLYRKIGFEEMPPPPFLERPLPGMIGLSYKLTVELEEKSASD